MELEEYSYLFPGKDICNEAVEWMKTKKSLREAWYDCNNGDWLWWVIKNGKGIYVKKSILKEYPIWHMKMSIKHKVAQQASAEAFRNIYDYNGDYIEAQKASDNAFVSSFEFMDSFEKNLKAEWIRGHVPCPF